MSPEIKIRCSFSNVILDSMYYCKNPEITLDFGIFDVRNMSGLGIERKFEGDFINPSNIERLGT